MGTFDWNNDGKTDATDDFLFMEVINKDDENASDDNDSFPTFGSFPRYQGSSSVNSSHTTNHKSAPTQICCLTTLVIGITILLCIAAPFMGYGNIIGDLLGIGFLVCLFTGWLESHP